MGFYLTLLYLVFMILSPATLLPELAPYRLQWVVAGLATLTTATLLPVYGYPIRNRQVILMVLFFGYIPLTRLLRGWMGGAMFAVAEFGTIALVFFLLCAGRPSLKLLRALAVALTLPALYAGFRGILALATGLEKETYVLDQNLWDNVNITVLGVVERIRYVGSFSDPNDLAQYFLVVLPFVALLWKPRSPLRNFGLVVPLVSYLLVCCYLTHSRGSILGLLAIAMIYSSRVFNKTVMLFASAALGVALLGANFAGGRSMSFGSGADRIEAWGAGLTMLRNSPVWGIGFGQFTDHNDITAHNSFVLCFAELGLVGFFLWLGMLISTLIGLGQFLRHFRTVAGAETLVRWAGAVQVSLIGFLATSWFLSRTYSVLLYVLLAMWVMLERLGAAHMATTPADAAVAPQPTRFASRPTKPWRWVPVTVSTQFGCLLLIWVLVRARWTQ